MTSTDLLAARGYRPMSDLERRAVTAAADYRVTYPVASPPKRLARSLAAQLGTGLITDRQAWALWRLVHTFRRQIERIDPALIDHAALHKDDPCPPPIRKATPQDPTP